MIAYKLENLTEPLEDLARFTWRWAPSLCKPEDGCQDYHRLWSLLRWFELNKELPKGEDFFYRELGRLAQQGKVKVLISGAADTGLLAIVAEAYRRVAITPQITLIDRCATPVIQNKLFAAKINIDCNLIQGDICDALSSKFDIILSHSFLLFFENDERNRVIDSWRQMLAPDGYIVLSSSISAESSESFVKFDLDKLNKRVDNLKLEAQKNGFNQDDINEMCASVERFSQTTYVASTPLTETSLKHALDFHGFVCDFSQIFQRASGPIASMANSYGRIELSAKLTNKV